MVITKTTSENREGNTRDSNIEFFRIISMLLIVSHHYVVNSGLISQGGVICASPLSWRSVFLLLFGAWGKTGINCFTMITGYYMCQSNISARKFFKLVFEVLFYRIIIYFVFCFTGYASFSIRSFIKAANLVNSVFKNYTGCFLIFYLSIPFLNILIHNLTRKQHMLLILLTGFTYVFFGTLHRVEFNYVVWFSVLYLIASFIRRYPMKLFENKKLCGTISLITLFIAGLSVVVCAWLSPRLLSGEFKPYLFVSDSNTFLAVVLGVSSFLYFKNTVIPYNKIINTISASTFGVLCIHANSETMRRWLWFDVLDNIGHYNSTMMPLHAFGSVLGIFVICVLIDYLRIIFIEKPFFLLLDRKWDKIFNKYYKWESTISQKAEDQFLNQ